MKTKKKNNQENSTGASYGAPASYPMSKKYGYDTQILRSARITFWFYLICIPLIVFIFLIPYLQYGTIQLSLISIIYIAMFVFFAIQAYRSFLVMRTVKESYCELDEKAISGINIESPYQKGTPFRITRDEILGVGVKQMSIGNARVFHALILNTQSKKYSLFAVDQMGEIRKALQDNDSEPSAESQQ